MAAMEMIFFRCMLQGPLGEVRFRRLHLGCHYDDDRQGHANALQRFASIISSFRIIIKFVGLRVQLKTRCLDVESHATIEDERAEGMNEGKPHVSTQMVRQGQVPLLLIHMLSFFDVYIEGLDVESLVRVLSISFCSAVQSVHF